MYLWMKDLDDRLSVIILPYTILRPDTVNVGSAVNGRCSLESLPELPLEALIYLAVRFQPVSIESC